ncbi:MAG TPA: ferredoxin [Planctomycetota bacterium]|nr:ferredoxin [Planctomycetota bacterium]
MKVLVDANLCEGCGPCEEVCPEVFRIVDNLARVIADPVPPESEGACRQAVESCPTNAISVVEE